jgi:micrococcal nuclease
MLSVVLAAALVTMAPARLAAPDGGSPRLDEKVRVVSVHDGDTITVSLDGRSEKVRLVGIQAPELQDERPEYREAAEAAHAFALSALKGKTVTLEIDSRQGDRDRYSRLLRYVFLGDGTNFNEELVRKGYAKVYDRFAFTLKPQFKTSEAEAKRQGLGVWKLPPGKSRQVPDQKH